LCKVYKKLLSNFEKVIRFCMSLGAALHAAVSDNLYTGDWVMHKKVLHNE